MTPDDHLNRLLCDVEVPWYKTFLNNCKEFFNPPKLPDLELTSTPVAVDSIWGLYGRQNKSFFLSTGLQVAVVVILLILGATKTVQMAVKNTTTIFTPLDTAPPDTAVKIKPLPAAPASGGGGDRSPLPASYGKLPRFALKQFTPPVAVYNNMQPKLAIDPTLIGDPNMKIPNVDSPNYGNPLSHYMTPSNGQGSGSGIGDKGKGNGVGDGSGPGYGGTVNGSVFRVGNGVTNPSIISKLDPEYPDEARKSHKEGTVQLSAVIDTTGHAVNIHILHGLGMGLDEAAEKSLAKWLFVPGKQSGKPVNVEIQVDIKFLIF